MKPNKSDRGYKHRCPGLLQSRAGRNGSIGKSRLLIFAMTLVQDTGPDGVQFIQAGQVDILNKSSKKEVEVGKPRSASIDEMTCCDTVEVIYIFS